MSTQSNTFSDLLDSLEPDFDDGYTTVSTILEPLFFAHLARKHGLSIDGIKAGWRHYCDRRLKAYREAKSNV